MSSRYSGQRIEQWSTYRGPFDAPELPNRIQGLLPNGRGVKTSGIVKADGRHVVTETGSEYELGEPEPKFVEWLTSNDYQFDPEHPIRLVKKHTNLQPPAGEAPSVDQEKKT